jgi:hypothetical protein
VLFGQVAELKQIAQTETEAVRAQLTAAHERELSKVRDEAAAAMARLQEEAEVEAQSSSHLARLLHVGARCCSLPSPEIRPSAAHMTRVRPACIKLSDAPAEYRRSESRRCGRSWRSNAGAR